ncbi:MAG: MBL fold metallo-hydrolase [Pirellulales bacterium]|nr:MBL fold metallo-hydrolase [Pirellulales bacterium]
MSHAAYLSADLTGQLVFLGTGTSVGVPCIGCGCPVCASAHPRNQRLRSSIALGLPGGTLLVDTTPDLRQQLLRERIGVAHAILYTHDHADHVMGLDDVRVFSFYLGGAIPVYCEEQVEARLRKSFDYAFAPESKNYAGGVPTLDFRRVELAPFDVLGTRVVPLRLRHGRFEVLGFRFGNVAYCTDTNGIPAESQELLADLDVLILDALRPRPHVSHFSLQEAIDMAQRLGARRTIFTHMGHEIDHEHVSAELPDGMELAFDGLRVALS